MNLQGPSDYLRERAMGLPRNLFVRPGLVASLLGLVVAASLLSGCMTYADQRTRTAVQEREDLLLVQEEVRRVAAQVEGLEIEIDRLQRDLNRLREEWRSDRQMQQAEQARRLQEMETRVQALDRARETDRREIVQQLSGTIEQLMQQVQATRQTSTARQTHSGYGYEHVVKAGETLSHIAAAYGVTTRTIINANNLQNPDRLRVGQKLFIPE